MTSSSDRSATLFASPSAGRRIFSKFASPFAQKSRSISEFVVEADDPHKQHSPGEKVTGHVILRVVKPIRVTHISICLHGYVQVYRTPGSPPGDGSRGNIARIGKVQGKKSGEYWGNGFASLFEDETVLCGDGRLAEGSYRFDFEVAFPDDIVLPSSIDFERGVINYMITATLTRPTTISPVLSYDQRLFYVERIDIARLLPPKSRTITLEPVTRKARTKAKRVVNSDNKLAPSSSASVTTRDSFTSSTPNTPAEQERPRTASLSESSLHSRVSSNAGKSVSGSAYQFQRTSDSGLDARDGDKTITATVESLKGGCLRGDSVPVKILINHTKHIKSMNGVIVTLYRLSRVDMHPALPLGPAKDGQTRKYEDYYPRSLTGLGGLSLSGAGSSHVFRKDLAQTIVPLIVDPSTLSAEINAKVRVPEDIFPTITTVPGQMISFRYYIEVVLDIQGKLGGHDKYLAQQGVNGPYANHFGGAQDHDNYPGAERSVLSAPHGAGILDTAPIRREKSVVTCVFEMILGTLDTDRHKGKAKARPRSVDETVIDTSQYAPATASTSAPATTPAIAYASQSAYVPPHTYDYNTDLDVEWSNANYQQHGQDFYVDEYGVEHGYDPYYDMSQFVPPQPENEEDLPEKERLRRAEARLMPSQPPDMGDYTPQNLAEPSAPVLPQDGTYYTNSAEPVVAGPSHFQFTNEVVQPHAQNSHAGAATSNHHHHPNDAQRQRAHVVWTDGQLAASTSHTDDKQELERRQLQLTTSAPPIEDTAQPPTDENASAPMMGEHVHDHGHDQPDQEHGTEYLNAGAYRENLPRYQR
ncbi:hypothetical protein MBLNU459_g8374t1 [Dothideomycetes sp. NU459]